MVRHLLLLALLSIGTESWAAEQELNNGEAGETASEDEGNTGDSADTNDTKDAEPATDSSAEDESTQDGDQSSPGEDGFPVESDDELEANLVPRRSEMVDLTLTLGKRWYDDTPFTAQGVQFTAEASIGKAPIRIGPSVRYFDLDTKGDFFEKGSLYEVGARVTAFWDDEHFLPYLSIDYTAFSSGSLQAHRRYSATLERSATLEVASSGADLILGTQFFISGVTLVIETSLTNASKVDLDGTISEVTTINDETTISESEAEDFDEVYQSINIGIGFEL